MTTAVESGYERWACGGDHRNMLALAERIELCACVPGVLCARCEARGYASALAGYAARIFPALVTPADEAREDRRHFIDPDGESLAYDTCGNCGQPVTERSGGLVTMVTGNGECYGSTYRPGVQS